MRKVLLAWVLVSACSAAWAEWSFTRQVYSCYTSGMTFQELADAGVRVLGGPTHEDSGLTYPYIEAPDGVVVELTQYETTA